MKKINLEIKSFNFKYICLLRRKVPSQYCDIEVEI